MERQRHPAYSALASIEGYSGAGRALYCLLGRSPGCSKSAVIILKSLMIDAVHHHNAVGDVMSWGSGLPSLNLR